MTATIDAIDLTGEIVAAYVAKNSLPAADLPGLMTSVYDTLCRLTVGMTEAAPQIEAPRPAVPIKKSVTDEYLISLEDGQKFKSLKRHLLKAYNLTPQQYREKWGLPADYPMVAPAYAKQRSALSSSLGLGRKKTLPTNETQAPNSTPTEPASDTGMKRRHGKSTNVAA